MRKFLKFVFSLNFLYIVIIAAECAAIIFLCLYLPAFMTLTAAFAVIWLLTVLCLIRILGRAASSEISCALALFVVVLPIAGAIIYLIASLRRKARGTLTLTDAAPTGALETAALSYCGTCAAGYERAVYFKSGGEYLTALIKEIERARRSVFLEYFILSRGKTFSALVSALKRAKDNGAEIKIIIDGLGSAFRSGRKEMKRLKDAGAEVRIFHRLTPFACPQLNYRDHRKIAAIDDRVAFTGGVNLADEYANIESPYGYWKDTGVAVYGAAAEIFGGMFLAVWNGSHEKRAPSRGKENCLPFFDRPSKTRFCEDAYAAAISAAREKVHVFTPYFCVGEKLNSALAFAAMRGVDVRVVLPHIPDKRYAFEVSKTFAAPLAERGVKFYEYTPGFMHAKSMVCDDSLFIGSYNFDFRSMRLNYENGVAFEGEIALQAERDFRECVRLSAPLREEKLSPPRRILRFFLKLFAPLM